MRPIERFLAATRKIAKTPPILESEEYMGFFKQISMGLFNAEFIEVFSTHVFPETIKFKNGQKFIVWDSAYWFIVYNILNLYFLVNHASDDESYTCIENNLEANIYYFLSLMTCDYPTLSTEAARGYAELVMKKYEFELSLEQMDRCNNLFSEALYIAKIYCLFHELNHMDYMDDESHLNERTEELAKLHSQANELLTDNFSLLERLRRYYSEQEMRSAIQQIVNRDNRKLELELICDLTSFYDTVGFFEDIWSDLSKDAVYSRVHEIILVMNSINFALIQAYQHWIYLFKLASGEVSSHEQNSSISQSNADTFLRYVFVDLIKAIDANEDFGDAVIDVLNTDYFGLRYQADHSLIEEVMRTILDKECFAKVYYNTTQYKNASTTRIEKLRDTILGWS